MGSQLWSAGSGERGEDESNHTVWCLWVHSRFLGHHPNPCSTISYDRRVPGATSDGDDEDNGGGDDRNDDGGGGG